MNRIRAGWVCGLGMVLFSAMAAGGVWAEDDGFKEISAPEVKSLIDERKAAVVNLLSRLEHEIQHIPGSINIPIVEIETTDKLPREKDAPVVFYCMGER